MSVPMKKHLTSKKAKVIWHGSRYSVPLKVLDKYKVTDKKSETESVESVFGDLIAQYGEPAVILKGLRTKEGLSQIDFAKKIGISQQNLSAMENGRRSIGREMAKRIAKKFGIDYRLLL